MAIPGNTSTGNDSKVDLDVLMNLPEGKHLVFVRPESARPFKK